VGHPWGTPLFFFKEFFFLPFPTLHAKPEQASSLPPLMGKTRQRSLQQGQTRPPLDRMLKIHQAVQAGEYPNAQRLAKAFETSAKTVRRDLAFMRDRWELPLDYDPARHGYFYTRPVSTFPALEMGEGEMVALFVAQKAVEQYRGTPFEAPLGAAFRKLSEGLKESVSIPWSGIDSAFSVRGIGTTELDLPLFQLLSGAILNGKEVAFDYSKLGGTAFEPRLVQPYHLASINNQWYLFSFDLDRQQRRTFALPRIRSPRLTGGRFERPVDFDIARELEGSFGVFQGREVADGRFTIRLHFSGFAARLVQERLWHPSQQIFDPPAGEEGAILRLELENLEEITRWILSWGPHIRVLEPGLLRERVRLEAAALLANHSALHSE